MSFCQSRATTLLPIKTSPGYSASHNLGARPKDRHYVQPPEFPTDIATAGHAMTSRRQAKPFRPGGNAPVRKV